nr:hypothetical protein [Tanacetum cinerariifolium]
MTNKEYHSQTEERIYNVKNKFEALIVESTQHLLVPCSNEEIVKYPTQPATTKISGQDDSNLELDVLIMEEAGVKELIMGVEDEPLMLLGSDPDIIKEDFFNDLDGQHSTDESKPYHNTLK